MNNTSIEPTKNTYLERVIGNDAAMKGAAAMLAGVLVAVISQALWPSQQ